MKSRRIYAILFVTVVLMASLWLIFRVRQEQQQAQVNSEYYATILVRAPCIADVCPGFEGRDRALEHLSGSDMVKRAGIQGRALIGFALTSSEAGGGGGLGGIYFTTDSLGNPQTVHRISFRLYDMNLEAVLDTLGEPDEFLFIAGCGLGNRVHAKLFFLSRGVEIVIDYETRRPVSQVLATNTPVHWIEYFSPADFQNHVVESLNWHILNSVAYDLPSSVRADDFIDQIRPWRGIDALSTPTADFCPR